MTVMMLCVGIHLCVEKLQQALFPFSVSGLIVKGPSGPLVAPLGSSVVLHCSVDELLSVKDLEVEWRRTDPETLVHLYQDGESRPEVQQQDYRDRAHFFTDQIQRGNFSLRLDNLRAEDKGQYKCKVYIQQESGETAVEIKVNVERLRVSGSSRSISASVGEDVTLNCSVDSHIPPGDFEEVTWKKTDEGIQVLLYQDNKTHSSNERYIDRVELFPAEIPKGNFSLRLKSIRTEDKGVYMCEVIAGGISANATVVLERLGFSASHIMMLILCISASGSALLLCCLIYCRSPTKGLFGRQSYGRYFILGSSVVMPCHVEECFLKEKLKVEWRRKDTKTLVHLYEDGETRSEKQHKDYQDRAHFFTDDVQHGNFSLRLDKLRAADAGEYICTVHSDLSTVTRTAETSLVPRFKVKGSYGYKMVPLEDSVVLPCEVDESLLQNSLKVEWRRTDSETLVHLYEDGESQPKKQHKDYHHRAHFITDEIKEGNFSIRLEKLKAEDAGKYTCKVYSDQDCVHSADAEVILSK
uniref:Ig-like domain-containing protein n=1 Tax=Cyprinus carpio TaxID=7962 RepID=A0A8C1MBF7_CYPCA